jgi:hypothetical protein
LGGSPTFANGGNNIIGVNNDFATIFATSSLIGTIANPVDPKLAPLGNYGGPTQTHALLPGSLAIDAGDATITTADQRGVAPVGIRDIGAYEYKDVTPITPIIPITPINPINPITPINPINPITLITNQPKINPAFSYLPPSFDSIVEAYTKAYKKTILKAPASPRFRSAPTPRRSRSRGR